MLRGLFITKADLDREANRYSRRISEAPGQEREFVSIARQQEIKAGLYLMLLQKREENAITLASTANNGRIIKAALPSKKPVSPKKKIVLLAAFVLGMGIPVGLIYLKDLLKYKIENAEDVEKITDVPILGELPLSKKPEKGSIVVQENQNGMMEEAFRGLRTNMLFMLGASQKVVLFTSTQPGEGKSFIAGNTAVSLAYMGKKVVIVGLDIRKPGLNKVFNLSHRTEGITNYLADPEHTNLFDMIQHSDVSPNLDILPGGPIPPNPTELMARTVLEDAIEKLKERYDYIILDTAPIAIVTDTAIASRVADMCVYVCRADVTPKLGYQYINVLRDQKKFDKLATVINSIDLNSRKSGYGYGHKYGYGYGHKYGYGYGMTIAKKISIESGITHKYTFTILFKDTNANQNYNQGKEFNGVLGIEEYKAPDFATDSWSTIIANVKAGKGREYVVGSTKEVNLGSSYGTHTLRVANTSTPSECSTAGFSQTACGFVLEFADIIATHKMNDTDTTLGGWPATLMRTFVNNDIYNAIPSEIKNAIIDTTVVSGHGKSDTENFTSTDKLYLLSTAEVWAQGSSNTISGDTAKDLTRQLDYYKNLGTSTNSYSGAIKKNGASAWWLRTPSSNTNNYFYIVIENGDWSDDHANATNVVSPAFRLG